MDVTKHSVHISVGIPLVQIYILIVLFIWKTLVSEWNSDRMKGLGVVGWNLKEGQFEEFLCCCCCCKLHFAIAYPLLLLRKLLSASLKIF
jgi:hypothetical protein